MSFRVCEMSHLRSKALLVQAMSVLGTMLGTTIAPRSTPLDVQNIFFNFSFPMGAKEGHRAMIGDNVDARGQPQCQGMLKKERKFFNYFHDQGCWQGYRTCLEELSLNFSPCLNNNYKFFFKCVKKKLKKKTLELLLGMPRRTLMQSLWCNPGLFEMLELVSH